jgi:feruloyl esterase
VEAQRFSADYDGIAVGSPVSFFTHLQAAHLWKRQALDTNPTGFVPPSKLALIHSAVLKACDRLDGVNDGVLEDPTRCDFDPKNLECQHEDGAECLTAAQVNVVSAFYAPTRNPRTREQIYPGLERGGERGWSAGVGHMGTQRSRGVGDYLRNAVFQDPAWDYKTFDFDADIARADRIDNGLMNAVDPNLRAFFQRGGRLLQYHGWSDESVSPRDSINYYTSVVNASGGASKVKNSYRLFMIPGMFHCGGGDGTNTFDSIGVLERWVEARQAPDRILASRTIDGKVLRTRPLCPYPQVAQYNARGSADEAANFTCRMP